MRRSRRWEADDGSKRSTVEVQGEEVGAALPFATAEITKAEITKAEITKAEITKAER